MIGGVKEEIGEDLTIGARKTVDHKAFRHIHRQRDRRSLQDRPQARDDLVCGLAEAELAPFGVRPLDMPVKPENVWRIINGH